MADIAPKLVHLSAEKLLALHNRIHKSEANPATIEVHHTILNELARRKIELPSDEWDKYEILIDSIDSVDLTSLGLSLPKGSVEELIKSIGADLGNIKTFLTSNGYQMRIEPIEFSKHLQGQHDQKSHAPKFAEEIAQALDNGEHPSVEPKDVGPLFAGLSKLTTHPDITELKVKGTMLFGDEGMGIARKDMPQIPAEVRDKFIEDLGVDVKEEDIDPKTLKPIQKEVSGSRSGAIYMRYKEADAIPDQQRILISKDGFVIDGHHTWGAAVALSFENAGAKLPVYRIDMNAKEALDASNAWADANGYTRQALDAKESAKKSFLWEPLEKHGTHDQKTHGSWATGTIALDAMVADIAPLAKRSEQAIALAKETRSRSEAIEPALTAVMKDLAQNSGAIFVELEQRLKSTDSLARKIDSDAEKEYNGDCEMAARNLSDAIRYTLEVPSDTYTENLSNTVKIFESAGWSLRTKNFWQSGDPYDGVNIKGKKNGVALEIQLHTKNSASIKAQNHKHYETYRESTDNTQRRSLWDNMVKNAERAIKPANYGSLLGIGTLVLQQFETAQQAGLIKSTLVGKLSLEMGL